MNKYTPLVLFGISSTDNNINENTDDSHKQDHGTIFFFFFLDFKGLEISISATRFDLYKITQIKCDTYLHAVIFKLSKNWEKT